MSLLKVYCDFNDHTADDRYWILWFEGRLLAERVTELALKDGDRVLLYQDADDFEVEATLLFNQLVGLDGPHLCARPDWQTRRNI